MKTIKELLRSDMMLIKKHMTRSNILLGLCLLFVMGIMLFFHLDCPILHMTGISCPGCGMTRAYFSLLQLDFKKACYYHPLWWLPPFVPVFWLLYQKKKLSYRQYQNFFKLLIVIFLGVYVIRLLFFPSVIVRFYPKDSMIFQILSKIKRGF